jgi:hypothetical protein
LLWEDGGIELVAAGAVAVVVAVVETFGGRA